MAHSESLPEQTLKHIASQIGERLSEAALKAEGAGVRLQIGESLPVWTLGLDATTRVDEDIRKLATNTGFWHHQILHGEEPKEFARSRPTGPRPDDWTVKEVVTSHIADRIGAAIVWVDRNYQRDAIARILIVPAYYLHALWLDDGNTSQIVVADKPKMYSKLEYEKLYTSPEFLRALNEEPHAMSVPRRPMLQ